MRRNLFTLAQESESLSPTSREIEYVYYARLLDASVLSQASRVEEQEQYEIKGHHADTLGSCRFRARRSVIGDVTTYTQAMKVLLSHSTTDAPEQRLECQNPCDEELFNAFKRVSAKGITKFRHVFPIPGSDLFWEIDCVKKPDGSFGEWVKIDLEVSQPLSKIPPVPVGFELVITNQKAQWTPDEAELVSRIYNDEFFTSNPACRSA